MRFLPLTIVVLLALAAGFSPAEAQCPPDVRDRVLRDLEITDVRIEQAIPIVAAATDERAQFELRGAQDMQTRARAEFVAGHCRIATDLTMGARNRVMRALEIARGGGPAGPGLPDPQRVLGHIERTRELLERARDRIEECDRDAARAILRTAFDMQRRAEEAMAQGRPLAAFQLTVSARERGLRALRLCNMQDDLHESAEHALRRTDEILSQARELIAERGDASRGWRVLARAIDAQERAHREFRAGRLEASLRLTQTARTLAHRAIRLAGGKQ